MAKPHLDRSRLTLLNLEDRTVPSTFMVLNTNDDATNPTASSPLDGSNNGTGTLRQAIVNANANAGPDTIVFDSSISSGVNVIALLSALPAFTGATANDLTIQGPGADHMIITRGATAFNRAMLINSSAASTYQISGLTLTGFSGTLAGGAIGITTANQTVIA